MHWHMLSSDGVHCFLCPHNCKIAPGERGRCGVRENQAGELFSLNYGQISGIALDPMEKKPLYQFCPGSLVLSVGSRGCNLDCGFCQNWSSVTTETTREITVEQLVVLAQQTRPQGNCGVAFTYTEPLMWYEFVHDAAKKVQEQGMAAVLVSNGFIQQGPWLELLGHLDAVNIDLKAFSGSFYKTHCGGSLEPVKKAITLAVGKVHLEVTTLLVEGHNTGQDEIRELSAFLADLDPDIPLHLSRYYPARRWKQPPTDPNLVQSLAELARKRLNYVYTGNLPESWLSSTYCPKCQHTLVQRGAQVQVDIEQGHCPRCKYRINIRLCKE